MMCDSRSLVKISETWAAAITLPCRSWLCPNCQPMRQRQLIDLAQAGIPNKFLTLTAKSDFGVSPADRARHLAECWRTIIRLAERELRLPKIQYLAVFEATKRGEPHLHILLRSKFIPQRWLSRQMGRLMNSPVVDIRQVKSVRQAAYYISKYVGKAPHRFATSKRYWATRGWVIAPTIKEHETLWGKGGWEIDERPLWIIREDWSHASLTVTIDSKSALQVSRSPYFPRAGPWHRARAGYS